MKPLILPAMGLIAKPFFQENSLGINNLQDYEGRFFFDYFSSSCFVWTV